MVHVRRPALTLLIAGSAMASMTALSACASTSGQVVNGTAPSTTAAASASTITAQTGTDSPTASTASTAPWTTPRQATAPPGSGQGGAAGGPAVTTAAARLPAVTVAGGSAATVLGYRFSYRPATQSLTSPKGTTTSPQLTVTGGSATVRAAAVRAIEGRITAERRSFAADATDAAGPDGESEQEISVVRQVQWGWLYSVQFSDYRGVAGTAHPVTNSFAVTIDTRNGRALRASDVFPALGPVDTAVRAALRAKGVEPESLSAITVAPDGGTGTTDSVDTYPTAGGLWVGVSQCVAACALGVVEVTVPWSKLPTPRSGVVPPATR